MMKPFPLINKKIALILLVSLLLLTLLPSIANAQLSAALATIQTKVTEFACTIYRIIQAVVGVLAILMIILAGLKWMTSDDPDSRNEAKSRILYVIVGVVVVLLALDAVNLIAKALGIITTDITCASLTSTAIPYNIKTVICIVVRVLQAIAGIIAMILLTLAGFKWIAADSPEDRAGAKKTAVNTILGVLIVILAVPAVLQILFFSTTATEFACASATSELTTNIITPIQKTACVILRTIQLAAGFVAAMAIMFAGLKWLSSDDPGDRSAAKNMVLSAIFGFLLILIAAEAMTILFDGMVSGEELTFDCDIVGTRVSSDIENIIKPTICVILRTITAVAGIIAGIVIMLSGIKWLSSDDPEDRSDAKRLAINAILGFFVVILAAQAMATLFGTTPGFTSYECASGDELPYVEAALCIIFNTIKAVAGIVAAIIIALAGIKWMSSDAAAERGKAKGWVLSAIVGFFVVVIGAQLSSTLFAGVGVADVTGCGSSTLTFVEPTFCVILKSIQAVAAIIAAVVIGLAGMKWMAFDVDFEERNKAKGLAINAIVGLLIVLVGVQFMTELFTGQSAITFGCTTGSALTFVDDPLCIILNLVLVIASLIAAIAFLLAAFRWFIAAGDPESRARSKGAIFNVVVGFLIVLIAVQFVNVVLTGKDITQITCSVDAASDIAQAFSLPMCIMLRAIQLLGILIAMVVMLIAGMRWIVLEDPEQRKAAKSYIFYSLLALVVVLLVTDFINAIIQGASGIAIKPADITTCGTGIDAGIADAIQFTGCMVFRTMEIIAIILAVIATLYVGIKLMSTDDPEERSTAKMMMFNVLVGLTLVILTTNIIAAIVGNTGATGVLSFDCTDSKYLRSEIIGPVEFVGCMFYWVLLIIAIALAVLIIMLAGLKWMFSDTPEARRSAKNMILYVIVGTLVAILAWQIVGAIIGQGTVGDPFSCGAADSVLKTQIQYTVCLFIELIRYSVAALATILIAIAAIVWMFSEDPERRTWAKWLIGHVIIGALIIMAAAFFINALLNYESGGGGSGTYIMSVSCACIDDILLDDEIDVTVSVTNPGSSSDTFNICVVGKECTSKDIAAGATDSATLSSNWDPGWSLNDLGGSFSVSVTSSQGSETYGPVSVPTDVSADGDCCDHSGATITGGGATTTTTVTGTTTTTAPATTTTI